MAQIAMREVPDSNLSRQIRDPERLCGFPQILQARAVILSSLDNDCLLPNPVKPITLPIHCKTHDTAINTTLRCSGSVVI